MNKLKFTITIIILLYIISCGVDYKKDSNNFNHYLNEIGKPQIPVEKHYYFVVPKQSCQGCVVQYLDYMSKLNKSQYLTSITIISSYPKLLPDSFEHKFSIIIDPDGNIDSYNIDINNFSVLSTENGRICSINKFLAGQQNEFWEFLVSNFNVVSN